MRTIITIAVALFIGAISARDYQRAPTRAGETLSQSLQKLVNQNGIYEPLGMKYQGPDGLSVERSIWNKMGDGFKKAGKGIEKGAEYAAPYAIPALELAGEFGGLSVEDPMIYDGYFPQVETSFFKKIGHGLKKAEPYIVPAIKIAGELGGLSVEEPYMTDEVYRYYPRVETSFFKKIGHGLKKAEPYIVPAIKIAGELGGLSVEEPMGYYDTYIYPSVERSIFNKIGDGFKKAGKGIEKGAGYVAPYAIPALELAGEFGGLSVEEPLFLDGYYPEVERSIFNKIGDGFKKAGKGIEYGAKKAAPYAIPALEIAGTIALGGLSVEEPNVQQVFYGPNYYPYPYPYPYYD
ncbi:UNKNOWN [Stylonychia lemnae]|uniref:Uncharacterized protein n=1 Tax=Stylonychia lemnae TaxID=5949 RepID=A0A078A1J9_STYLE|nr:UNKNOWN [Stylonychia lemnae]|eukprot:CDW75985.1 UNKNOWN [Stylonychia lemnae]